MIKLRQYHAGLKNGKWWGVNINSQEGVMDAYEAFVWEPMLIRKNALTAACEVILVFPLYNCLGRMYHSFNRLNS